MSQQDDAPKDGSNPEEKETPEEKPTVGDILETEEAKKEQVPLNKYMDEKRARKDAEARAEALQADVEKLKNDSMAGGMPILEISTQLKKIAEEHNVDETFLAKLISTVEANTKVKIKEELEKDYTPKLSKLEKERQLEKAETKFNTLYSDFLKEMPEYEGIASKDIIKMLVFNPANAKKTLPQIIEETYGNAIKGRQTIESDRAGSNRKGEEPDYTNPSKDDWDKIESSPEARKKWAESAEDQIKRAL